jgi:Rieske Fe-S protein
VKSKKENEFYTQVMNSDNLLNKQLKASEDAARTRAASNGKRLEEEWQRNTEFKIRKKIEDDERNNRVRQTKRKLFFFRFLNYLFFK